MMMSWLYRNWVYAAIFTAGFLLPLAPLVYAAFGWPLALLFLHLPMYQVHQLEEHYQDRFRRFVNGVMFGGIEALTPRATFWINCLGVWVLDVVLFYPAFFINAAWGLGIVYMVIVNAVSHIGVSVAKRRYNPGVATSVVLFLPVGIWTLHVITVAAQATWMQQAVGLGIAVVGHAMIQATVLRHKAKVLAAQAG